MSAQPMNEGAEPLLLTYTLFPTVWPTEKTERADAPWSDLVGRIKNAAIYIDKQHCPLISLCEYGSEIDEHHKCLRYAENVQRIYGIEIDYDGELVALEVAARRLHESQVTAALYTSPSHKLTAPRWRVLLPLSEPALPEKRAEYVGRVNRILGGIITRESFTLSQSFYIGRVRGAEYEVAETQGRCIDLAAEIEPLYFGNIEPNGRGKPRDTTTDADLRGSFDRGEDRYQAMLKLSSRWAARGLGVDDIEQNLLEMLGAGSKNADGIDLRTRARPMAESAVRKFGETRKAIAPIKHEPSAPFGPDESPSWAQEEGEEDVPDPQIEASLFVWVDPSSIPPRPWIYANHYMRGMVSATAGIGGAGKTSLLIVEALSIATGRDLFSRGEPLRLGPLHVWLHNEDPMEEMQRRIGAICIHYNIKPGDFVGQLHVTSSRTTPIMIARTLEGGGKVLVPTDHGRQITEEIQKHQIGVFVVDPFVSVHRVSENDNVQVEGVMTILRGIAEQTRSSIELAHHFRKLNGNDPSADDIRGASAIVGACRSVRVLAQMTQAEADEMDILPEHRRGYVWLQNAKANMSPPLLARKWFQLRSTDLDNASGPYLSDSVGVTAPWDPPAKSFDLTPPEFRAVRLAFKDATAAQPLNTLRMDVRSSGWAGRLVAKVLELDPDDAAVKVKVRSLIDRWINAKQVRVVKLDDPKQGRRTQVLEWVEVEE